MKFRLIIRIAEWLLGKTLGDEPRADMFLPMKVLALGLFLLAAAAVFAVYAVLTLTLPPAAGALACVVLGAGAVMCWRNQTVEILSDEEFVYTTFLGARHTYRFADITGLRRNRDSMTLMVGGGEVHIESNAQLSERLVRLINAQLEKP